jgi:hypothetical protein
MPYDSTGDTKAHIDLVRRNIAQIRANLLVRAETHDDSKLKEPEKSAFDRLGEMKQTLGEIVYGSPEYAERIAVLGTALDHHYEHNRHHPEHWPKPAGDEIEQLRNDIAILALVPQIGEHGELIGRIVRRLTHDLGVMESRVNKMSLLDVVEMLADHAAASRRTQGGSLRDSLRINTGRFVYSDQLAAILENTRNELEWD